MKRLLAIFILLCSSVFAKEYTEVKLDSGQTVVVREVKSNPLVIIDTWIKTGSINENDDNNGVAHFLEHLFFKGSEKYPAKLFDTILESKGAITNAATSRDFTHYYILIPSKDFQTALELHSNMLLHPLFPPNEIENERGVVIEEISRGEDSPSNVLYNNVFKTLYKSHPYKRQIIGTRDIISNISREQILDFYNKYYIPSNMTTIIVGDVDTKNAIESVKTNFATKSKTVKIPQNQQKPDKSPGKQVEVLSKMDIETGYMILAFKGCPNINAKENYALDVLSVILADGRSSRLYKSLKDQKQLINSVSASNSNMKDDSIFMISSTFPETNSGKIKNAVFEEVEKVKKDGITQSELQKAKNIIERDTLYSKESVSNIANELGYILTLTNSTTYYDNYLENIKKVTVEEVKQVAIKYLTPNNCVISTVLPKTTQTKPEQENKQKNHSYKILKSKGNITKYELENKTELIINENNANDIIAIDISSPFGAISEKTKGVASIVAQTMTKGTKKYSKDELAAILEENGIKIGSDVKTEVYTLALKFTKNEKDLAFDILNEIVNNAVFNTEDIEKAKKDKMFAMTQIQNQPSSLAFDEYKHLLWQGTPYDSSSFVLKKSVPLIKRENVLEFYKNLFDPKNVKISVTGNVDKQEYINRFTEILPKTDSKKVNLSTREFEFPQLTKNITKFVPKKSKAYWIVLGWHTDGIKNEKDSATLEVINSILGSGMSSRLFNEIRDVQGLAYQIGSDYSANMQKGVFSVYVGTNKEKAEIAKKELFSQISRLKNEFVGTQELEDTKNKIIGNFILSQETNLEKAATLNWFEMTGRGFEFFEEYKKLINSVTMQDIINVSNKYFSQPYIMTEVGEPISLNKK